MLQLAFKIADDQKLDEAAVQSLTDSIDENGQMIFDVWVDADNLIRRIAVDANADGTEGAMEIEYFDFNEDFDIPTPAASDVFDISSLANAGQ